MVAIEALSRIGFGCHLVTLGSDTHRRAMVHALQLGCNLFDTSANYMEGASEALIGQVLAEQPDAEAFVVTKSGVVLDPGVEAHDPVFLEPDTLGRSLTGSLERLRRRTVDAYLLHNPEVQLAVDPDRFYPRLRHALEFLEHQVHSGRIRYYGISSNTFHQSTDEPTTIDLRRVLSIAEEIASDHHFRFVEFPYNLVETGATEPHHGGASLVSLARARGLVTLSNRPLNARTPEGALRLALYDNDTPSDAVTAGTAALSASLQCIARQLRALGEREDPLAFGAVRHLHDHWTTIGNPEAAASLFQDYLYPFLLHLYGGPVPPENLAVYERFYAAALLRARHNRAERTRRFLDAARASGTLLSDERPLPVVACEQYLRAGIHTVLVGMRRTEYVDAMRGLFRRERRP